MLEKLGAWYLHEVLAKHTTTDWPMTDHSVQRQFWPLYLLSCPPFLILQSQSPKALKQVLPQLHPVANVIISQLFEELKLTNLRCKAWKKKGGYDSKYVEEHGWILSLPGLPSSTNKLLTPVQKVRGWLHLIPSSLAFHFHAFPPHLFYTLGSRKKDSARFCNWEHGGIKSHDGLSEQMRVVVR